MKNKLLSLILAGAMAVSLLSTPAVARAEEPTPTGNEVEAIKDSEGKSYATINEAVTKGVTSVVLYDDVTSDQVVIPQDKKVALDLNGHTLTVTKDHGPGIYVQGSLDIGGGSLTKSEYGYLIDNRGTLNIIDGTYTDDTQNAKEQDGEHNSALIRNLGTMTVSGGTFTDSGIVIKNDDADANVYGKLLIEDGTFNSTAKKDAKHAFACLQNSGQCTVSGGTFNGGSSATVISYDCGAPQKTVITGGEFSNEGYVFANFFEKPGDETNTEITGGTFNGNFLGKEAFSSLKGTMNTVISGGTFTTDVSNSLAEGYCVGGIEGAYTVAEHKLVAREGIKPTCLEPGTESYYECENCGKRYSDAEGKTEIKEPAEISATGHHFEDGVCKDCGESQVQAEVVTGETKVEVTGDVKEEDKETVAEAAKTVAVAQESQEKLTSQIEELTADETSDVVKEGLEALKEIKASVEDASDVVVYQMVSLKVEAKAYDVKEEAGSLTLDIYPVVQKVAAPSTVTADAVKTDGEDQNAVKVGTEETLAVENVTVKIELKLPNAFADKMVYITHKAKTGYKYYEAKANKDANISFENPDGFSDFTFSLEKPDIKTPSVSYRTHVQTIGWQESKKDGATSGTEKQSKRLEAIKIKVDAGPYTGGIEYKTHIQSIGWEKDWVKDDKLSGTEGQAKRLEAIQIRLTGEIAEYYDVYYRVHAQTYGWLDWAKNGESAGTAGFSKRLEAIEIRLVEKTKEAPGKTAKPFVQKMINYRTHVQTHGWQEFKYDGATSGTSGQSKRLEGIEIKLGDFNAKGSVEYRTHIQSIGWEKDWKKDGNMSGTSGQAKRLEAIQIRLTDEMAEQYDVYYRVHAQTYGWLGWAKNGESAGTEGMAKRLEAIQIKLVEKGGKAPESTGDAFKKAMVSYRTHVQTYGWQGFQYDGATSGTSGQSKRLEGIEIKLGDLGVAGSVEYRTHVQTYGWEKDWKKDGDMSGTSGQAKRLEAIQIRLTDDAAAKYDIYYRVHAQTYGWLDWACNGDPAGTAGYAKRLEAIQIQLVEKGGKAPGKTDKPYVELKTEVNVKLEDAEGYVLAFADNGKKEGTFKKGDTVTVKFTKDGLGTVNYVYAVNLNEEQKKLTYDEKTDSYSIVVWGDKDIVIRPAVIPAN